MNVIKLKKNKVDPVEEVIRLGGKKIKECIQCGACMSVCPVAMVGFSYPTEKLFKLITLGIREEILYDPSPWACVACGRCVEICVRDVNPLAVYLAFRRLQAREFSIPKPAEEALRLIYETGHGILPEINIEDIREELGLERLPNSTLRSEEALDEVRKILESSEIAQLGILPGVRI